jgi:glycosyltransferase involved in cell wall biosynthesis
MKVVGFTALHYGRDYLGWAIRSIIDHIDEYHVAYTAIGSHGHRTPTPCPETRDELYAIAQQAAGDKLHWHDGEWPYEGAQRDSIFEYAPDADMIVVLDADEIWHPITISKVTSMPELSRRILVPMVHFWRSFYRAVIHDPAYPVRVIYPNSPSNETVTWSHLLPISHMGYAQRPEIVQYKQLTHGHRNEWRKDVDWFTDKFMANAQTDCHPVGSTYWNPERVDPMDYLPRWMMDHPFYFKDIIE